MDVTQIDSEDDSISDSHRDIGSETRLKEDKLSSFKKNEVKIENEEGIRGVSQFFENPIYGKESNDNNSIGDMVIVHRPTNQAHIIRSLAQENRKFRCCTYVFLLTTISSLVVSLIMAVFMLRETGKLILYKSNFS